jgi:accessory gene regulator protein AgrB
MQSPANKMLLWLTLVFTISMMANYYFVRPQEMAFDAAGLIQCCVMGIVCIIGFSLIQFYKPGASWIIIPNNLLITALCLL